MTIKSKHSALHIIPCNLLDYLFPYDQPASRETLWIDADDENVHLSPAQMLVWVKRLGQGLQKIGVGVGDSVLVFTSNHIFVPVAYLGTVGIGAAFSGASPAFTVAELVYQIKLCTPKIFLFHPSLFKTASAAIAQCGLLREQCFLIADRVSRPLHGYGDWSDLMTTEADSKTWRWKPLTPEESRLTIGTLNFSSGTTGLPKGVAITHSNLIHNTAQLSSVNNFNNERWLSFLPLYHAYGQCYAILMAAKNNVKIRVMRSFDLSRYLTLIKRHRITRLQVVPPILIMLDKRPEADGADLSSVREIMSGGAPLSKELQQTIERKFQVRISQGWGLSETTCAASAVPWTHATKTGSVGLLLPETEMKLIDDEGKEVGYNERGEAYLRGPQIAMAYWKNAQATTETFEGGWLKTGDVAVMNDDGYIYIVDRKKELIKVKGLQVSPAELEALLIEHPEIEDAAVAGITLNDKEWPRAYVKLAPGSNLGEKDIQEWIKPRVGEYKWLAGGVVRVDEVPKLASGKIQRRVVREWAKRDAQEMLAVSKL